MASAEDIAATLRFIAPGFVALSVIYWFGLKTKRTDLQLTLWSLIAAAPIDAAVSYTNPPTPDARVLTGIAAGVVLGATFSVAWRLAARAFPALRAGASPTAWDAVLAGALWVNVWTKAGDIIFGTPRVVALSVETDDVDLYLEEPAWVDRDTGDRNPKPGTAGILIRREEIQMVEILAPVAPEANSG